MNLREDALPQPPERRPYLRVRLWQDQPPIVLRMPSTTRMGALLRELTDEQRTHLIGVASQLERGRSLLALMVAAEEILPIITGLVGLMWADPLREIEAQRADGEDIAAYGTRLLEELHEAGFEPRHLALLAITVAADMRESADLEAEVAARAGFFRRAKASLNGSASPSSATTSAPTEDDISTS